ncbi:MAG: NAD(P)-dependent oxidoreductase [Methylovirgula sp.]
MTGRRCGTLIITGGRGYLGEAVIEAARAAGVRVCLLSRDPKPNRPGIREITWQLGEALPRDCLDPDTPPSEQALIHLAHYWSDIDDKAGVNLIGARILRDSARAAGLGRLVFISSQSARVDALNAYGRVKWAIEQLFDAENDIALRVGLVYGGPRKAQYGLLCTLAMMTSILPMVRPHQPVQPIRRDEVARGILLAAENASTGVLGLAGPEPIAFSTFLDQLAWRLRGGRMLLIPLPLSLALGLSTLINKLPLLPHVDRERILGLAGTRAMPTAADLGRLGLTVPPFAEGMLKEPAAWRALIREGRTLLHYVTGSPPSASLLHLYMRALRAKGEEGALRLPRAVHAAPFLLRFMEPLSGRGALKSRLQIATALAARADGLRGLDRGGRLHRLSRLAGTLLIDAAAMPTRLLATLWP